MINLLTNLFRSSLGKKYIMSLSGFVLVFFIIGHAAGNLQIFIDREMINKYGAFLHAAPELLWIVRLFLIACVALHIWSAAMLTIENRSARPVDYAEWNPTTASYASRTMMVGGIIIASFLIYHLLHYTALVASVNLTGKDFSSFVDQHGHRDIFKMMVVGFRQPIVSVFYLIAVGFLALHLSHGLRAMFQSLGWKKKPYANFMHTAATSLSILIFAAYASIPVAILLGYGKEALN